MFIGVGVSIKSSNTFQILLLFSCCHLTFSTSIFMLGKKRGFILQLKMATVASTAFHAQELGFRTILVDDCSRGINSEGIEKTKQKIRENNGVVIHSQEVKYLLF